ncbi:hypothetical protein NZK81_18230, partial [Novosphingobium sp. HK4-1]|nr:hypothetical protein [Novosphingobium mangrovi (ex Huang et al. 2023)]
MTMRTSKGARRTVLAGASLAALGLALGCPPPARAQSFQGSASVVPGSGSAFVTTGAGTTNVEVLTPEAVIDWTPTDTTGTGTIDFQPAGTTTTFTDSVNGGGDFTVLNRILPVDSTGAPVARMVAFNGTVQSTVFGAQGGNVWFYSPTGIILGATANFNVGSLVLTTNPIDTTGGLYGTNGEIRFRGGAGSTGLVQIDPGAQVTARINPTTLSNAYVALVAPRIVQGGTIDADGPTALVAAEQVDLTINAGLFDIVVTQGTTDANGIVHTGSTGGATTIGSGNLPQAALVAVPKNDGMTMLLSGTFGYTPATAASVDGGSVVLSAGNGLGFDTTGGAATGNIAIGDAVFTSTLTANASDTIDVAPTSLAEFDKLATLDALQAVDLTATNGAVINALATAGMSLDVHAGDAMTGGTINVTGATAGVIDAAGSLRLRTSGNGSDTLLSGFDGVGGTINIAIGNAQLSATQSIDIDANGYGGTGITTGGDGIGGTIAISAAQGSITSNGLNLYAGGYGGSGDTLGGAGLGG